MSLAAEAFVSQMAGNVSNSLSAFFYIIFVFQASYG